MTPQSYGKFFIRPNVFVTLTVVNTVWHAFCYGRDLTKFNARLALNVSRETICPFAQGGFNVSRGTQNPSCQVLTKVKVTKTFGRMKNLYYLCSTNINNNNLNYIVMEIVLTSRFVRNDNEEHAKVSVTRIPVSSSILKELTYQSIRSIQKGFLALQATKGMVESVIDDSIESITETEFGFVSCRIRYENGDMERCDFHAHINK